MIFLYGKLTKAFARANMTHRNHEFVIFAPFKPSKISYSLLALEKALPYGLRYISLDYVGHAPRLSIFCLLFDCHFLHFFLFHQMHLVLLHD